MKTSVKLIPWIIILVNIACATPEKEELASPVSNTQALVSNALVKDNWYISFFYKDQVDITPQYEDYILTFSENETVNAVLKDTVIHGSWNVDLEDGSVIMNMNFDNSVKFEKLSDKWYVSDNQSDKVSLEDLLRGGLGTTKVRLKKHTEG